MYRSGSLDLVSQLTETAWLYRRIGHDERRMTFSRSGRVEVGAADLEKYWQIVWSSGRTELELHSDEGTECRFTLGPDLVWRGHWERFEKMPIELRPDVSGLLPIHTSQRKVNDLTFSQSDEEQFLNDFFAEQNNGRFLDVGAADGLLYSNTRKLFLRGWSGALVEPIPELFWRLQDLYSKHSSIRLLNAAVSDRDGYGAIWACSIESRRYGESRDTIDPLFAQASQSGFNPALYTVREVRLVTAATMLKAFEWSDYDFISVDAEGLDGLIIRNVLAQQIRPRLILWEADKSQAQTTGIEICLKEAGYSEVFNNTANRGWART